MSGRLVALGFTVAIAVVVGLSAWRYVDQWREGPGPRLRRDCTSLVDTVMAENPTVSRFELEAELDKRGVKAPAPPSTLPTGDSKAELDRWLLREASEQAEAQKRYEAAWAEIRKNSAYQPAWDAALKKKRGEAITDCIVKRAQREGVTIN